MIIPKTIHQTWKKKNLPRLLQKKINKMLKLYNEYEYCFYDDNDIKNFIENNCDKQIISAYHKLKVGAEIADYFRYIILYYKGGIYLDIDALIYKRLDNLIENNSAVIFKDHHENIFHQFILIFCPGLFYNNYIRYNINKDISNISYIKFFFIYLFFT